MLSTDHPQDDLLIADALLRESYRLEDTDPARANRANDLASEIISTHGLRLCELQRQIDRETYPE
ncbi:hypothetical protein [Natrinema ejinorense]|uniref:Uncharacterized protein n=1 Tax=Natrinema ejinorense TaxID=373386 RepID=A0A2A5QRN7_9EURY|nr:hypothetical protein [Natrinema ejinorense]PCR89464.1 hypothetical protein CP557_02270 [Natrinema ejinorense]